MESIYIWNRSHQRREILRSLAARKAELAPAHIRKTAEYVGAFVYRFNSIENLVNALFGMCVLEVVSVKRHVSYGSRPEKFKNPYGYDPTEDKSDYVGPAPD